MTHLTSAPILCKVKLHSQAPKFQLLDVPFSHHCEMLPLTTPLSDRLDAKTTPHNLVLSLVILKVHLHYQVAHQSRPAQTR